MTMRKNQYEKGILRSYGTYRKCSICGRIFHSLGMASHRSSHFNEKGKLK